MFQKQCSVTSLLSVFALAALVSSVSAQDADVIDLGALTCRDYLSMGGEERDNTALFLQGYFTGKAAMTEIVVSVLSDASDKVTSSCIDDPAASLLSVFEANRK